MRPHEDVLATRETSGGCRESSSACTRAYCGASSTQVSPGYAATQHLLMSATLNLEPTDVKKQFFDSEESFVKVARIRSQDPYRVVEDVKFKQEEKEAVIPQEDASIGQQNVCLSSRR